MNQTLVEEQLLTWIKEFVERPNPLLNNWPPCPYARQARINNKIEIKFTNVSNLSNIVNDNIPLLEDKDVIIFCFDHTEITSAALAELVINMNQILMKQNVVALEDHPDTVELINGVKMNFGHCGLLLVSKLDKLNSASDQLRSKGYYDTWSQANIDDVVSWR